MTYDNTGLEGENEALRQRVADLEAELAPGSIAAEIAAAEAAGDYSTSIRLKVAQSQASRTTEPPPVDPESQAEEMPDDGSYESGLRKLTAFRAAVNPVQVADTDLDTQITEAQEADNWAESLRLKSQKIGLPI